MEFKELYRFKNDDIKISHTIDTRGENSKIYSHYHANQYEINFIIGKNLGYMLNQYEYQLGEYNLIIIPPMSIHSIKRSVASPYYETYNMHLNSKPFLDMNLNDTIGKGIIIPCKKDDIIHNIYKKIDYYYYKSLPEKDFVDIVYILMREVLYNAKMSKHNILGTSTALNPILSGALSFIYENYNTIKSVSEIASSLFISERYLNKIFKKHLETTPKKYLTQCRLGEAKILLQKGVKPIEVCDKTGFSDYTVFYRSFKSFFGYPPSKQEDNEKIY